MSFQIRFEEPFPSDRHRPRVKKSVEKSSPTRHVEPSRLRLFGTEARKRVHMSSKFRYVPLFALSAATMLGALIFKFAVVPLFVVAAAFSMMAVERMNPGRAWPSVKGWWWRVIVLNAIQAAVVLISGSLWDIWMLNHRPFNGDALGPVWGAVVGYLAITFVFYWWHRARHRSDFLWRTLHQIHHSPQRIEVITSFVKHPFELISNGIIVSATLYIGCGLGLEAASGALLLSGLAELFYHWNVKTPHWIGYIIQRPESHCIHHESGHHDQNFGDLPLWDWLFGTLNNPKEFRSKCGFGEKEYLFWDMLLCRDVHKEDKKSSHLLRANIAACLLLVVGLLQMTGDLAGIAALKGLGAATMLSPAPKVFTAHKGHETYSVRFIVSWKDRSGEEHKLEITPEVYGKVQGPYQRRNVYGAVLSYGPVFVTDPNGKPIFDSVSRFALSGEAPLLREIGVDPATVAGPVTIHYVPPLTVKMGDLPRTLEVSR